MDIGLIAGLVSALAVLVLLWPAVRRAGPMALPALLFWAVAIAAVTALVMLVEQWQTPPMNLVPPSLPPPQRGVAT